MISRLPSALGAVQQPPRSASVNIAPAASAAGATETSASSSKDQKLKESVQALEGLFVQQLYKSMRETVPQQEGIVSGGAGEDIFTSLMDEHLAAETPKQWERGLAEALYRQLRGSPMTDASQHAASTASKTL